MAAGLAGCAANQRPTTATSTAGSTSTATTTVTATSIQTVSSTPLTTAVIVASTPIPGAAARFVNSGPRQSGQVALTFHAAGRIDLATRLLDLLKRSGTPVTIFAVGEWMQANPQLVARMVADGHELANHTWTHGAMRTMSAAQLDAEITKTSELLKRSPSGSDRWFRPSQIEVPTDSILAAAGRAGYGVSLGYDVDSLDFQDPGAAAVRKNVIDTVQPGSVVSLHFDHTDTIEALPAIIEHLNAKAWKPVTATQLFGVP